MVEGPDQTIPSRLRRIARAQADDVFCEFLGGGNAQTITFSQLYERSMAYAAQYARMGVQAGDVIIVMLEHTPHLFYSYVGAILMGAIPSFMPFPSPKQRPELFWADHEALFARIRPRLLVTYERNLDAALASIADFVVPSLVAGDAILAESVPEPTYEYAPDPASTACLQHSSGTTSLKKGVMLTHRILLEQIDVYATTLGFERGDSIASWLPLYHDMGFVACFMMSLLRGTRLVALDPFEWVMRPTLLLDAIEKYRTSFCWLPNFAFAHIANSAKKNAHWDLSSTRAYINCSEPCKRGTFEKFLARFSSCGVKRTSLQICYAMAENVFAVTQTPRGDAAGSLEVDADAFARGAVETGRAGGRTVSVMSCGTPIAGTSVRVCDPARLPLPEGAVGEIAVSGTCLFEGYYLLPDKTAERVSDGWYYTGDMGFVRDGELYVTGRVDDMIIVNGRNYYAHEIEAIVSELSVAIPGRNVAIGVDDPVSDGTAIVILAECNNGVPAGDVARAMREAVFDRLGIAILDAVAVAPGRLVKTTSGKISRTKNKELYLAGAL